MSFEPNALFLSFLLSFVGLALFLYGRKQSRAPQLVAGLLFMVYPYFTSTFLSMLGVGALVGAGMWVAIWLGY